METKKVLILGGGFGGVACALELARRPGISVTVVDQNDAHTFTPLLYEIATTSEKTAGDACLSKITTFPFSTLLEPYGIIFLKATVSGIDTELKTVATKSGILSYDYLVLGLGSEPAYFNIPGLEEYALTLKTWDDAITIRNTIVESIEKRTKSLNIVVAGGGATGVELSGEIATWLPEMKSKCEITITLFDGNKSILNLLSEGTQIAATERLKELGVNVRINARMESVSKNEILFTDKNSIPYDILIWTGGVQASKTIMKLDVAHEPKGRIETLPTLEIKENSNIFALGDNAFIRNPVSGNPTPWMARPAIVGGRLIAHNILASIKGKKQKPFEHQEYPYIIPVGGKYAIAHIGEYTITGFLAWIFKGFVELNYFASILPFGKALSVWFRGLMIFIKNDRLG